MPNRLRPKDVPRLTDDDLDGLMRHLTEKAGDDGSLLSVANRSLYAAAAAEWRRREYAKPWSGDEDDIPF